MNHKHTRVPLLRIMYMYTWSWAKKSKELWTKDVNLTSGSSRKGTNFRLKYWLGTYCEVELFEISSKCFTIASTILVVRVTRGADERADNGGFDRMQTSPFLSNLWNKFFKSLYWRPLPTIFSAMFCFTGLSWWPGWYNFPLKDRSRLWRSSRYFISCAASFTEINELLFTIISFERATLEENKILRRAETSSRASWASKVSLNRYS